MRARFAVLAVLLVYLWIGGNDNFSFDLDHGGSGSYISYNHLAESFLAGKLHLLREPDPRLLELPDPYNPGVNSKYRWHDATLYKGKFYSYFGPAPVIFLYLPVKALTGGSLSDTLAATIFMFGAVLWGVLILLYIKNRYFPNLPRWMLTLSILTLGLSNSAPMLVMKHGGLYHVAIACGCFFLFGALYWLITAFKNTSYSIPKLILASTFLGISVGGRPQFVLIGIILLVAWLKIIKSTKDMDWKKTFKEGLALFVPISICLLLLGIYNYLRFDSFTEFGFSYQIGDIDNRLNHPLNIANLIPNLYIKLLHLQKINAVFPFIHNYNDVPYFVRIPAFYYQQHSCGLFPGIMFLCLPFIALLLTKLNKNLSRVQVRFPKFETLLIGIAATINLSIMLLFYACGMRFIIDIAPLLIILTSIYWFYTSQRFPQKPKTILNIAAIILASISMVTGMASGIEHVGRDRKSLQTLESTFKPLARIILKLTPDWEGVRSVVKILPVRVIRNISSLEPHNPAYAVDNKHSTSWIEAGTTTPTIILRPYSTNTIKTIWLLSRHTSLFESWKKLDAKFYLDGNLISEQSFSFPDADKKRIQYAELKPTNTDEIHLTFSDPVTINFKGEKIKLRHLGPGYTEILIESI